VTSPALSVVVVSVNGADSLRRCLDSLAASRESLEILVVADAASANVLRALGDRAGVEPVSLAGRRTIPQMRAAGFARARAGFVAVLADYYEAGDGWASAVVAAHRRHPRAAVGGAVENRSGERAVDWAGYLTEYHRFMLPFVEHRATALPGPNASYQRDVLLDACADLLEQGAWDHRLHERLAARGVELWMDPAVVAYYAKRLTVVELARQRYRFGRSYAAAQPMSGLRRVALTAAAPAIVALQLWRIAAALRANPRTRGHWLRCAPLFLLGALAWSAGEVDGLVRGDGGASLAVR